MKRDRAFQLVSDMLGRLTNDGDGLLAAVDEVHVFGSFARGALEPHDVDIAVEYTPTRKQINREVWYMTRGRSPYTDLRAALAGRSRGLQIRFRELESLHDDSISTTLLWRRGDSQTIGLERLAAIQTDPAAGRALRDAMHPAFEGIDRWVPRPVRHLLTTWAETGAVTLEQVDLPDTPVRDVLAMAAIEERWVADSAIRRAAAGASSYLESRGVDLRSVHLHGKDIDKELTPHYVGVGWRYIDDIHYCLTECDGKQWLEVPRATRRSPLRGILITLVDHASLKEMRDRI